MPTRRQRRGGFALPNPFSGLFGQEKKEEPHIEPVAMPVRVAMFKKTYDGY